MALKTRHQVYTLGNAYTRRSGPSKPSLPAFKTGLCCGDLTLANSLEISALVKQNRGLAYKVACLSRDKRKLGSRHPRMPDNCLSATGICTAYIRL